MRQSEHQKLFPVAKIKYAFKNYVWSKLLVVAIESLPMNCMTHMICNICSRPHVFYLQIVENAYEKVWEEIIFRNS